MNRDYWIERGKDGPKYEGFVCIGKGEKRNTLTKQLGIPCWDGILYRKDGDSLQGGDYQFSGNSEKSYYYIKEKDFAELFLTGREYWLDRGKNGPKREGFVCIGKGDQGKFLHKQLNISRNDLWTYERKAFSWGWDGSCLTMDYYLTQEKFDELFPVEGYYIKVLSVDHYAAILNRLGKIGLEVFGEQIQSTIPDTLAVINNQLVRNQTVGTKITLEDLYKEPYCPKQVCLSKGKAIFKDGAIHIGDFSISFSDFEILKAAHDAK